MPAQCLRPIRRIARSTPALTLDDGRAIAESNAILCYLAEGTPLGRWGRPQDVAGAALYLASPEAAFVTGQAINVNGGVVM